MAWRWVGDGADADAAGAAGLDQEFPTQADAEAWLSGSFENLLDAGLDAVTLYEGDRVVYGPMSLNP